jgi:tRNA 2-selenouridine synthase
MVISPRTFGPSEFLDEADKGGLIVDVRAPIEYFADHIAGAISWPLFTDDERSEIGTLYNKNSKDNAIDKGFEIIGPRMGEMVRYGRRLFEDQTTRHPLLIYCWRGGMRSQSVAWFLRTAGIPTIVLDGGYKAYRTYAISMLKKPINLAVLGGLTGSAKTDVIRELEGIDGERVVDLEGMARHFGSAFGNLDGNTQPSSKQFSNALYARLRDIDAWGTDTRPIWVENESKTIGQVNIPQPFYSQMVQSTCFEIIRTDKDRIDHLVGMYGDIDMSLLADAFKRISPKLGGDMAKIALNALEKSDLHTAASIALIYYDKTYSHGFKKRNIIIRKQIDCKGLSILECAYKLHEYLTNYTKS